VITSLSFSFLSLGPVFVSASGDRTRQYVGLFAEPSICPIWLRPWEYRLDAWADSRRSSAQDLGGRSLQLHLPAKPTPLSAISPSQFCVVDQDMLLFLFATMPTTSLSRSFLGCDLAVLDALFIAFLSLDVFK
jgi:hypothetical protein